MADKRRDKKRGPRGGIKHRPGRGHDRKSRPHAKERFRKKAAAKKAREEKSLRRTWHVWDSLTEDKPKMRPDLKPNEPRPSNET
jgi:hypothetical protein